MQIGVLNYRCLKCGKSVQLAMIPTMQENTQILFENMFDSKLCIDCHCNKRIPELVTCLIN